MDGQKRQKGQEVEVIGDIYSEAECSQNRND